MIEIFTLNSDLSLTRKIAYPEKTGAFGLNTKSKNFLKLKIITVCSNILFKRLALKLCFKHFLRYLSIFVSLNSLN